MAIRIANILDQLPNLSVSFHRQIAEFVSVVLKSPMTLENGGLTLGANVCLCLWFQIATLIQSEEAARQYSQCLRQMYQIVCDTDDQTIYPWWMHFWSIIASKYPDVALDHLDHLLHDSIDRKQSMLTMFMPVIICTLIDPRVNEDDFPV